MASRKSFKGLMMSTTNHRQEISTDSGRDIDTETVGKIFMVHDENLPDIEGLDTETGMHNSGGMGDLYLELLATFVVDYADFGRNFARHVSDGEWDDARRLAHTLKGVASMLGIASLRTSAESLEVVCKLKCAETALQQLEVVTVELSSMLAALQRFFAN